jgi:hypothetical protein
LEPAYYILGAFLLLDVCGFDEGFVDFIQFGFADDPYLALFWVDESAFDLVLEIFLVIFKGNECGFLGKRFDYVV